MSSGQLSLPGAQNPNEDWLSHKLSFNPLPLNLINPLHQHSERMSENTPTASSWVAPEQWQFPPGQSSKQPPDVVDRPTESRKPRCISLSGLDALKGRLKNLKWAQASPPSLEDKVSHDQKPRSNSVGSHDSVSTGPSTIRKSIESGTPRFLGRYLPPVQRRSASLPRIDECKPPHPHPLRCHPTSTSERQVLVGSYYDRRSVWQTPHPLRSNPTRSHSPMRIASPPRRVYDELLLGGPSNQTRPGYQQIPRYVPLEIRQDATIEITSFSMRDTDDMMGFQEAGSYASGMDSRRATRATSDIFPPNMTLPFTDDGGKYAKSKLVQKIQDNKIVKKITDKGAKLQDKGAKLWMYVKVTLKNHGWYYGDDGAVERWLAGIHGTVETNETTEETD